MTNPQRIIEVSKLEAVPPGWGGTVKAMKKAQKRGDMDKKLNPFALAKAMDKKGYKPHYKERLLSILLSESANQLNGIEIFRLIQSRLKGLMSVGDEIHVDLNYLELFSDTKDGVNNLYSVIRSELAKHSTKFKLCKAKLYNLGAYYKIRWEVKLSEEDADLIRSGGGPDRFKFKYDGSIVKIH